MINLYPLLFVRVLKALNIVFGMWCVFGELRVKIFYYFKKTREKTK